MNDKGVYRTAPATPGLLITIMVNIDTQQVTISSWLSTVMTFAETDLSSVVMLFISITVNIKVGHPTVREEEVALYTPSLNKHFKISISWSF